MMNYFIPLIISIVSVQSNITFISKFGYNITHGASSVIYTPTTSLEVLGKIVTCIRFDPNGTV